MTPQQLAVTGIAPRGIRAKASQIITNVVGANTTLPLPVTGSSYYVLTASAKVDIRPMSAGSVGIFDTHVTGTGKRVGDVNAFEMLEVKNNNAFPVVFSIFVGWDDYIDKRLIVATDTNPQVAFNTYDTPNSAAIVNITDKSGQTFTDINGGKWYAINRVAILVFNTDGGVSLLVQKANSVVGNGPAVANVPPLTAVRLDFSGNYRINLGGANINAIVTEIYNAVANPIP